VGSKLLFQAPERMRNIVWATKQKPTGIHFCHNWLNPEQNTDKAWIKTEVMIEANTSINAQLRKFSQRDWSATNSGCEKPLYGRATSSRANGPRVLGGVSGIPPPAHRDK